MTSTSRPGESVSSFDQSSPLAPRVGDRPAPNKHRSQESTLGSTAASNVPEGDGDTQLNEIFGIRGSSLQPGRTPVVRDSSSSTSGTVGASVDDEDSLPSHLTEEDVANAAQHDEEAEAYGPLTEAALESERARSRLDPRHPRRPLRYLKVGEVETDSEQFKAFRKFALENDFPIRLVPNPKDPKSESWKRYEKYSMAHKLRDIIELSVTSKDEATRRKQRSTALKDIAFDALRGYIQWPQHEHNASRHYVNAAWLAKEHRTVNIHALYSKVEMDTARKRADREAAEQLAAEIKEGERLAVEREKHALPMSTFHEVIKSLWDYDPALQLNDDAVARETVLAATLIADLITGDIPEPLGYRQATAANHPEREMWIESMGRERATLEKMGTWVMVPRSSVPKGHRPIKCKFVYRKKLLKDGSLSFKSRLVGCGYSQRAGVDFSSDELFAGVASYSSFRFLMSLACQKNYILVQSDIQAAYLQADLSESIWMEAPPDMWVDGKPPRDKDGNELCCLLKKSLYGLRQAGHAWGECFKDFLLRDPDYNMGFKELTADPNLYVKNFVLGGKPQQIILGVYVDDCLAAFSSHEAMEWYMERLGKRFPVNPNSTGEITMEKPGLVLSMEVKYDRAAGILTLRQKGAIEALATKIGVIDKPPRSLPITAAMQLPKLKVAEISQTEYLSIVGSCLHICQVSRPDCSYAIGVLCRHSATPGKQHLECAKNLVNYMYNTRELSIRYTRGVYGNDPQIFQRGSKVATRTSSEAMTIEERLVASVPEPAANSPDLYIDADYAGDTETRRSTSGLLIMMNGGPVVWSSRLQKLCAQSSAESEIYAVTDSLKEAISLRLLCEECGIREPGIPMRIWEDNNAAICLGHGLRGSKASKHLVVRLRFLNEHVHDGTVEFARINTKDQRADLLTKALPGPAFLKFRNEMMYLPRSRLTG